jgi:hypothetical protein
MLVDDFTEPADFIGPQKRRRAAAEMKLHRFAFLVQHRREPGDFAAQIINVIAAFIVVERNDRGAAAKPTERFTKRNVEINRKVARRAVVVGDFFGKLLPCHRVGELGRGRIAGVTRPGHVVFFYQIQIYVQCFHKISLATEAQRRRENKSEVRSEKCSSSVPLCLFGKLFI